MWVLFQSASGAWGDFLGAHSCPPTSSHSPWECIYLPLTPCTWFSPGHDPLKGRIYLGGLPEVAWVLHESGYSLLVLELWPWSHLSLLFIIVLRYWGFSRCRPLHGLSYPWVSGGDTVDALTWRHVILATPPLGDASSWRCLHLGDASSGQFVDFLPWVLWGAPPYVDFWLWIWLWSTPGDRTVHVSYTSFLLWSLGGRRMSVVVKLQNII